MDWPQPLTCWSELFRFAAIRLAKRLSPMFTFATAGASSFSAWNFKVDRAATAILEWREGDLCDGYFAPAGPTLPDATECHWMT